MASSPASTVFSSMGRLMTSAPTSICTSHRFLAESHSTFALLALTISFLSLSSVYASSTMAPMPSENCDFEYTSSLHVQPGRRPGVEAADHIDHAFKPRRFQ